jgi:hypothetical protein
MGGTFFHISTFNNLKFFMLKFIHTNLGKFSDLTMEAYKKVYILLFSADVIFAKSQGVWMELKISSNLGSMQSIWASFFT